MNKPFSVFKCDICGSYIDASDGMLEWLQKPTDESRDNPSAECLESIHIAADVNLAIWFTINVQ